MEIINTTLANEPKRRRKSGGKGVRGRRGARGWGCKSDHKRKVLGQWGSGVANAIKAKEAQAERTKVGNKWRRQLESSKQEGGARGEQGLSIIIIRKLIVFSEV